MKYESLYYRTVTGTRARVPQTAISMCQSHRSKSNSNNNKVRTVISSNRRITHISHVTTSTTATTTNIIAISGLRTSKHHHPNCSSHVTATAALRITSRAARRVTVTCNDTTPPPHHHPTSPRQRPRHVTDCRSDPGIGCRRSSRRHVVTVCPTSRHVTACPTNHVTSCRISPRRRRRATGLLTAVWEAAAEMTAAEVGVGGRQVSI